MVRPVRLAASLPSTNSDCVPPVASTVITTACTVLRSRLPVSSAESPALLVPMLPKTLCLVELPQTKHQSGVPPPGLSSPNIIWPWKKELPVVTACPLALKAQAMVKTAGFRLIGTVPLGTSKQELPAEKSTPVCVPNALGTAAGAAKGPVVCAEIDNAPPALLLVHVLPPV